MGKITTNGRSKGSFVKLDDWLTGSPAWRHLRGNSVKLLIHLMRLSQGNNGWGHREKGGRLFCSENMAAHVIGVARNTASAAFKDLIDHGFLRVVQAGHFKVKVRHATVWRLTFQPYPHGKMAPTNEWRNWKAEENLRAQKLNVPGSNIGQLPECAVATGVKTGADISGIGGNPQTGSCLKTAPHLDMPKAGEQCVGSSAFIGGVVGWWTAGRGIGPPAIFLAILASARHPAAQIIPLKKSGSRSSYGELSEAASRGKLKRHHTDSCRLRPAGGNGFENWEQQFD